MELLKVDKELVLSNGDYGYIEGIFVVVVDVFKIDVFKLDMKGDFLSIDGWDFMVYLVFIMNLED